MGAPGEEGPRRGGGVQAVQQEGEAVAGGEGQARIGPAAEISQGETLPQGGHAARGSPEQAWRWLSSMSARPRESSCPARR